MDLDHILSALIYLGACFAVFVAGHIVFVLFRRSYSIKAELVEMIDLAPTILNFFGCEPKPHIIEGRDLTPI